MSSRNWLLLEQWLLPRVIHPPEDTWQCLETLLIVMMWGGFGPLVGRGQQWCGSNVQESPTTKTHSAPNINLASVETPWASRSLIARAVQMTWPRLLRKSLSSSKVLSLSSVEGWVSWVAGQQIVKDHADHHQLRFCPVLVLLKCPLNSLPAGRCSTKSSTGRTQHQS
jgi:hypothetical protein